MPPRHHSQLQPRRADGTFAGPPDASSNGARRPRGGGDGRGDVRQMANALQRVANALFSDERSRLAGKQFGSTREVWKTLGYPDEVEIEFREFFGKYKRSDIAGRIVDAPAKTTWRRGFEIRELDEDGNPIEGEGETDFEREVRDLFDRTDFLSKAERLDRVAGIGRYAVMLIGSAKAGQEDLQDPLEDDSLQDPEDIVLFSVFREDHAEIEEFGSDPSEPTFELPTEYRLTLSAGEGDREEVIEQVHHSRVVHFADDPLEDDVFGRPRLERVFNRLEDVVKIAGGSAEMFWANVGGMLVAKAEGDVEFATEDKTEQEVLDEFADKLIAALHEQRRAVGLKGMELEHIGAATPDPTGIFEVLQALLAAGSEIPKSVLFGTERGDVAKSHDLQEWFGRIEERQERRAGPKIVRETLNRLIDLEVLSEPENGYEVHFPSLHSLDDQEEAEILQAKANAGQAIAEAILSGGDRAVRVLRTLIPELEGVLDDEMDAIANFVDEEDRETLADLAELAFADGPEPVMNLAEEHDSDALREAARRFEEAAEVAGR